MKIRNVVAMLALVLSIPFAAFAAGNDEGKQSTNDQSAIQVSADSTNAALNLNDTASDQWRGGWGRGGWGHGGWGRGWGRGWGGWGGGWGGWGNWGGWGGWSYPYYSWYPYYSGWYGWGW